MLYSDAIESATSSANVLTMQILSPPNNYRIKISEDGAQ